MAGCWNRGWVIVVVIGVLLAGVLPAGAQTDVDDVRAVVQQWLLQELDKPGLILVEYTYAGADWPDSSLGCPVPGETYTPGLVNGYRWTFLYDNMVRYEVHSGLGGTPAVLCSAVNVAPNVRLTTYNSPVFTLLVPEAWLVFPRQRGEDVLFAPSPDITCDQPGMRVVMLGRVANGVTPDYLLDQHLAEVGVSDSPAGRLPAGTFGRSTTYELVCDDGLRGWRVSAFVEYGSAARIEQWAPADTFGQWDELFTDMLSRFGPAGAGAPATAASPDGAGTPTGTGTPATAVATLAELPGLPLAHLFVGDVFLGALNDVPGRTVTSVPTVERRYLAFSPDGLYLSFIDVTNGQLDVLNTVEGRSPRRVAEGVDPRFAPAWNLDSARIAYVRDTGETDADGAALLAVHAVPVTGGESPLLATFAFQGGCEDDTATDLADAAYALEAAGRYVLAWLPEDRFLVSTRCDGGLGVLSVADGTLVELGGDLRDGALSPDHMQYLARTGEGLALLDFAQWQRATLPLGEDALRVAWGPDGQSAYYATATRFDSVTLDDPDDAARGETFFGAWPVTVGVYNLTLVKVDLTTDSEREIWRGQGRGVGRITPAPDGSGVLFSLVPSSLPLADVFRSGGDALAAHDAWPGPVLYWLPAGSSSARLVAFSGQPAFAPVTLPDP